MDDESSPSGPKGGKLEDSVSASKPTVMDEAATPDKAASGGAVLGEAAIFSERTNLTEAGSTSGEEGILGEASAISNDSKVSESGPAGASDHSASDISMAEDSDDGIGDTRKANSPQPQPTDEAVMPTDIASKKRKSPIPSEPNSPAAPDNQITGQTKKVKLDTEQDGDLAPADKSLLPPELFPAELWHRIFTFCPPKTLGNLLQVNKLFHSYLHPSGGMPSVYPPPLSRTTTPLLKPNAIWQASRRLFWPHMPTPLRNRTELCMWRLACSSRCQQCGKDDSRDPTHGIDLLRLGPGEGGVAAVWPFGICICGPCLRTHSKKVG